MAPISNINVGAFAGALNAHQDAGHTAGLSAKFNNDPAWMLFKDKDFTEVLVNKGGQALLNEIYNNPDPRMTQRDLTCVLSFADSFQLDAGEIRALAAEVINLPEAQKNPAHLLLNSHVVQAKMAGLDNTQKEFAALDTAMGRFVRPATGTLPAGGLHSNSIKALSRNSLRKEQDQIAKAFESKSTVSNDNIIAKKGIFDANTRMTVGQALDRLNQLHNQVRNMPRVNDMQGMARAGFDKMNDIMRLPAFQGHVVHAPAMHGGGFPGPAVHGVAAGAAPKAAPKMPPRPGPKAPPAAAKAAVPKAPPAPPKAPPAAAKAAPKAPPAPPKAAPMPKAPGAAPKAPGMPGDLLAQIRGRGEVAPAAVGAVVEQPPMDIPPPPSDIVHPPEGIAERLNRLIENDEVEFVVMEEVVLTEPESESSDDESDISSSFSSDGEYFDDEGMAPGAAPPPPPMPNWEARAQQARPARPAQPKAAQPKAAPQGPNAEELARRREDLNPAPQVERPAPEVPPLLGEIQRGVQLKHVEPKAPGAAAPKAGVAGAIGNALDIRRNALADSDSEDESSDWEND